METNEKLNGLRYAMAEAGVDGYIVPMADAFQSEFVPPEARRLEWLTGFTGSAGLAIILRDEAAFFTDGRYSLQAGAQLDSSLFTCYDSGVMSPERWLREHSMPDGVVGFDPWLFTEEQLLRYYRNGGQEVYNLVPTANLIDTVWQDKPQSGRESIIMHNMQYAGKSSDNKLENIISEMVEEGVDTLLLGEPEAVNWLLNIRGRDLPCTPVALCYAMLHEDATIDLFIDAGKVTQEIRQALGERVCIRALETVEEAIGQLAGKSVWLDPARSPAAFATLLSEVNAEVFRQQDPTVLPRACKNPVEVEGMVQAHIRDGVAVCKFLHWLEHALDEETVTEISAAEALLAFREEGERFQGISFDTIAGYGSNGAIVHYRATPESCKTLQKDSLFLVDSGGQYLDGTTDITRTLALGNPTSDQKLHYTLVLKGHIALARASFPRATTGSQLDALARHYLWQFGLDYAHGTGHGVGSYLNVHEGPQGISKRCSNVALQPGMILSNEPGYYREGEYGIRIENLVVVEEAEQEGFLRFRTLTMVPLDNKLVEKSLLTPEEQQWLQGYHDAVREQLTPLLDAPVREWLAEQ